MGIQPMVFCALLGCLISMLIIPLMLLPGLMRSIKVSPSSRGQHTHDTTGDNRPVCSLGGIALATSFLGVATLTYFLYPTAWTTSHTNVAIIWTALAILFLGLWNDFRPLRPSWKLSLQIVIAVAAYCQGIRIETFTNPAGSADLQLGVWSALVTVVWLVGLTKLIDFTSRIEGLTAGLGLVLLGLRAITGFGSGAEFPALCSIGIAGALVGFLIYNLPPAKIRLGGGGAGFVGFLIASLTTVNSDHESSALSASTFAAVLILPILGVTFADFRRDTKGSPAATLVTKPVHRRFTEMEVPRARGRSW
jgi:UDP-GlcNAc:undecaprenyl-phosphate GlcNAc-1-phosphate transferase